MLQQLIGTALSEPCKKSRRVGIMALYLRGISTGDFMKPCWQFSC
ncbi:MAG: hypothetical protein ACTS73_04115 [Arsenophonus sp. NEOnobi-MAG3]